MAKRKLPAKLDGPQVSARVDRLFQSRPMRAYHSAIPMYRALALMRLDEDLPDSFNSGISMSLRHTRIIEVVGALLGKAAGFVRYTDMVAKAERSGVPSQKLTDRADRGGRSLTVMNAELDKAKRKTRAMQAHQLVDGWAVLQLHRRGRPGHGFNWELEVCDPMTCAFPEEPGGAFVPKRLARKFTMLMDDAQAMYAGSGSLMRDRGGKFDWKPLSAPRALDDGVAFDGGGSTSGEGERRDVEVELCTYDDGYYVYHVIRNPSGGTGANHAQAQVLYCERNTTYTPCPDSEGDAEDVSEGGSEEGDYETECGAMAVVVPGDTFSFGGDGEKMLPVMFAVLNVVNNLNILRAVRGRSAIKDRPDMVAGVNATPEEFEQLKKMGALKPVDGEEGDGGSGSVVYVPGKDVSITPWQLRSNQDLDSLDLALRDDLQVAVAGLVVNTDPNVVAQATASAYHISTGETGQRHTNWLQNGDYGFAALDRMICNDIVNNEEEYSFTAVEAQPRPGSLEVPKGAQLSLTPEDLAFANEITVVTLQETEDQKNKRLLNALFLKDQGVRTLIDVIGEDTTDVTARVKALRQDYARRIADPILMLHFFPGMLRSYIRTGAGVDLPLDEQAQLFTGGTPPVQQPASQPSNTFAPAPTEPEAGGDVPVGVGL